MASKKRSYDAAFKLKFVQYAENDTNRGAARKYGVDEKRVREWKKQKVELQAVPSKKKRLTGGGRTAVLPDMEESLAVWIDTLRVENYKVSRSNIQSKALELARENGDTEFVASRGWLEKFFKRHHFSLRRGTTVSQRLPQDLIPKVVSFIMVTRRLRHTNNYQLSSIGNMDETPLWMDIPGETTVSRTGERSIPIHTTGHDKGRFTVCFSAMADGKKLNPFVVFKGVRPIADVLKISGVVVAFSRNGWMNEELTKDWVKRGWGSLNFNRRFLVWDAYRCHIMPSIRRVVKQTNTDLSIIPGGLTSQVQPADLSWNKPFKEAYKAKYNRWMATGEKSYTPAGNVRAPSKELCLQWIREAWASLSTYLIVRSFVTCGISASVNGTEDGDIHCLKPGGVASDALQTITQDTATLITGPRRDDNDEDPFADLDDDEDVLETNEVLVEDI